MKMVMTRIKLYHNQRANFVRSIDISPHSFFMASIKSINVNVGDVANEYVGKPSRAYTYSSYVLDAPD